VIGKNVYVDASVRIGDRCKIQNNVSIYQGVSVGNDVFVGPSATFTNDRAPRAFSVDWVLVETHVRDGASIGANATIVCGTTLREYCMVAAGAVVIHDVARHELVGGNPARHLGWVCRCGSVVSRAASPPEDPRCEACQGGAAE
jgi:acetyltransferase-like isoleucine patch superfamily enzyme